MHVHLAPHTACVVRCELDGLVEAVGCCSVTVASHLHPGDDEANICGSVDDAVYRESAQYYVCGDICMRSGGLADMEWCAMPSGMTTAGVL